MFKIFKTNLKLSGSPNGGQVPLGSDGVQSLETEVNKVMEQFYGSKRNDKDKHIKISKDSKSTDAKIDSSKDAQIEFKTGTIESIESEQAPVNKMCSSSNKKCDLGDQLRNDEGRNTDHQTGTAAQKALTDSPIMLEIDCAAKENATPVSNQSSSGFVEVHFHALVWPNVENRIDSLEILIISQSPYLNQSPKKLNILR